MPLPPLPPSATAIPTSPTRATRTRCASITNCISIRKACSTRRDGARCSDIRPMANKRLAVTPPVLLPHWLKGVPFHHGGKHATVQCETCHESAQRSANTADVIMPRRQSCVACHAGTTASSCVSCHKYHSREVPATMQAALLRRPGFGRPASPAGGDGEEMFSNVLLIAIVVLMLVLLVPVGIAVYQRLRVKPDERGPRGSQRRAPAPPPPADIGG